MGAAKTPDLGDPNEPRENDSHVRAWALLAGFLDQHSLSDSSAVDRLLADHPTEERALRELLRGFQPIRAQGHRADEPSDESENGDPGSTSALSELLRRIREDVGGGARFTTGERLGSGGIGIVFKLWDANLHRHVAKKTIRADKLRPDTAQRVRWIARFLEEAQITAQLDHPGVVPVHDLGFEPDGQIYFTMRYVRGDTFADAIQKAQVGDDGWNRTRAISTLLRVCETVAFAHGKDVIHRDLKPSNIMVGRYGETYVMDWGLARKLDRPDLRDLRIRPPQPHSTDVLTDARRLEDSGLFTIDGHAVGTPAYMSPEQARSDVDNVGKATDIYALGAILYEILAGHPPYLEPGVRAPGEMVCRWVIDGPPAKLHTRTKDAPAELVAICERAMAREPAKRYASVEAMADDLRAYLENRVVKAYRTGPFTELTKWVGRNRLAAGIAAALIVFSTGGGFGLFAVELRRRHLEQTVADSTRLEILLDEGAALPIYGHHAAEKLDDWIHRAQDVLTRKRDYQLRFDASTAGVAYDTRPADPDLDSALRNARVRRDELSRLAEAASPETKSILAKQAKILSRQCDFLVEQARYNFAYQAQDAATEEEIHHLGNLLRALTRLEFEDQGLLPRLRERRAYAEKYAKADEDRPARARELFAMIDTLAPRKYREIDLEGVVPGLEFLRIDPDSGLAEFWFEPSGNYPNPDGNEPLRIESDTALVFVLVPSGSVTMGYQSHDPNAINYRKTIGDPDTKRSYDLDLGSFLLSKYEMTQGQWNKLAGFDPASMPIGMNDSVRATLGRFPRHVDGRHPVESVTHATARRFLNAWNMRLPTNAQWVRVASMGEPLRRDEAEIVGNLYEDRTPVDAREYDGDGYLLHAPVGSFLPNLFGFYDLVGNVAELTADSWVDWPSELSHDRSDSTKALLPTIQMGHTICGSHLRTDRVDARKGAFSQRYRSISDDGGESAPRLAGIRPILGLGQ